MLYQGQKKIDILKIKWNWKEIKDIVFPDEAKKEEFITKAISIKTAKEYGTKNANK